MADPVAAVSRPKRRAPLIVGVVGAVVAGLVGVMAVARSGSTDRVDLSLVGRPAPAIVGTTLDGQTFDLAKRRSSWVLLNFFQSTCVPCVQEHPELKAFAERAGDQAELVTVVSQDSEERVRAFFAKNGGTWPVVLDPKGKASYDYGVAKVPETWVVDPDGVVRARVGQATDAATLEALLGRLVVQRGGG